MSEAVVVAKCEWERPPICRVGPSWWSGFLCPLAESTPGEQHARGCLDIPTNPLASVLLRYKRLVASRLLIVDLLSNEELAEVMTPS